MLCGFFCMVSGLQMVAMGSIRFSMAIYIGMITSQDTRARGRCLQAIICAGLTS
jgi:hypothetical protein